MKMNEENELLFYLDIDGVCDNYSIQTMTQSNKLLFKLVEFFSML